VWQSVNWGRTDDSPVPANGRFGGLKKKERRHARRGEGTGWRASAARRFGSAVSGRVDRLCGSVPGSLRSASLLGCCRAQANATIGAMARRIERAAKRKNRQGAALHGDVLGKERQEKQVGAKLKLATPVRPKLHGSFHTAGSRQIGRRVAPPLQAAKPLPDVRALQPEGCRQDADTAKKCHHRGGTSMQRGFV
jgi:hypothetical protein